MQRILLFFLLSLFAFIDISVTASTITYNNIEYLVLNEYTHTVATHPGTMEQKVIQGADNIYVYYVYHGANSVSGNVVIPEKIYDTAGTEYTVTEIGGCSFYESSGMKSLTIPSTVKSVGEMAFGKCTNLSKLNVSEGNDRIDFTNAFPDLAFQEVYMGRNWSGSIPAISKLTIGNCVSALDNLESADLSNLTSLTLGSKLTEIPEGAFQNCQLEKIVIPVNVTKIGKNAFANNKLKEVIIGSQVTNIDDKAFVGNKVEIIKVAAPTPPTASTSVFEKYTAKVYVPEGCEDIYYDTWPDCWYNFYDYYPLIGIESLTLNSETISGDKGTTVKLKATLLPSDLSLPQVFWESSNTNVATVNINGEVTILRNIGNCKITAKTLYADGPVGTAELKIHSSGVTVVPVDEPFEACDAESSDRPNDIFTLQGVCLKRNATQADLDALTPGLYIVAGKKLIVK